MFFFQKCFRQFHVFSSDITAGITLQQHIHMIVSFMTSVVQF